MDFDPAQQCIIGVGMNNTGATSDPARALVKLRMVINATTTTTAAVAVANSAHLSTPQSHLTSPALSCNWTSFTQQYDHPIILGGLSALVPWPLPDGPLKQLLSLHASSPQLVDAKPSTQVAATATATSAATTALVWLGQEPESVVTDAVFWDAVTGELLNVIQSVCDGAPGTGCYSAMGFGPQL